MAVGPLLNHAVTELLCCQLKAVDDAGRVNHHGVPGCWLTQHVLLRHDCGCPGQILQVLAAAGSASG